LTEVWTKRNLKIYSTKTIKEASPVKLITTMKAMQVKDYFHLRKKKVRENKDIRLLKDREKIFSEAEKYKFAVFKKGLNQNPINN